MAISKFLSHSLMEIPGNDRIERVLQAALQAADPAAAVRAALQLDDGRLTVAGQEYSLSDYRRIQVAGIGKAAIGMLDGLASVLGERICGGVLVTKHVNDLQSSQMPVSVQIMQGDHPVPGEGSLTGARALTALMGEAAAEDLVICLISGGGSALVTLPQEGVSLEDLQDLTHLLLACGAEIGEINTLRKHLDRIKGGGLAAMAAPARVIALILSDVIGSPLDSIASGPTAADATTYQDALAILEKYRLTDRVPKPVLKVLHEGEKGRLLETLKAGDPIMDRVQNLVVASNYQSALASVEQARREGFHTVLLTTSLSGEARWVGQVLANILRQAAITGEPLPRPACLVAGGETTVTIRGQGLGGRNQELALGAVSKLDGLENAVLVTFATDGEDGPTKAAGAVVTGRTMARARAAGLNPERMLQDNDSYHFFEPLGDLLQPGPTGTNVNDLVMMFLA